MTTRELAGGLAELLRGHEDVSITIEPGTCGGYIVTHSSDPTGIHPITLNSVADDDLDVALRKITFWPDGELPTEES